MWTSLRVKNLRVGVLLGGSSHFHYFFYLKEPNRLSQQRSEKISLQFLSGGGENNHFELRPGEK